MTWTTHPGKPEAVDEHGYRITWAHNKHGTWFNGWSPSGASVHGSYDKEAVKRQCDAHREKLDRQRQMRAAEKAAKEVA